MSTYNTYTVFAQQPGQTWKSLGDETATSRSHAIRLLKAALTFPRGTKFKAEKWLDDRGFRRNPTVKLPSKFTPAEVRVNEQGKVQIRINPARLGRGGRFARCVESVEAKGGARDPRAVCAAAGMKKYGKRKFQAMAQAGRKRALRSNPTAQQISEAQEILDLHSAAKRAKIPYSKDQRAIVEAGWDHFPPSASQVANAERIIAKAGRKRAAHRNPLPSKPEALKRWTVKVPTTPYDSGYTLSIKAKTQKSALSQARNYCSGQWSKYTGKPKTKYRLPRGTKATEV